MFLDQEKPCFSYYVQIKHCVDEVIFGSAKMDRIDCSLAAFGILSLGTSVSIGRDFESFFVSRDLLLQTFCLNNIVE